MATRTPFPINKYAHLEVIGGKYIVDGDQLIGIMEDPFPVEVNNWDIEPNEAESLIKQGILVNGFKKYTPNQRDIPVIPYSLVGYPKDSITRDVYGLLFYKNICIALDSPGYGHYLDPSETYQGRLDDLGIESKYMYGVDPMCMEVIVEHEIAVGHKLHPYAKKTKLTDNVAVIKLGQHYYIKGQCTNVGLKPLSEELLNKYLDLGFKLLTDDIQPIGEEVIVVKWKDGLYRETKYGFILDQISNGDVNALGIIDDQMRPLTAIERMIAKALGFCIV